jgi:hypothetical protein
MLPWGTGLGRALSLANFCWQDLWSTGDQKTHNRQDELVSCGVNLTWALAIFSISPFRECQEAKEGWLWDEAQT